MTTFNALNTTKDQFYFKEREVMRTKIEEIINELTSFNVTKKKAIEKLTALIEEDNYESDLLRMKNKPEELKAYTGKFNVGDTVKVLNNSVYDVLSDWDAFWIDKMNPMIMKEFEIISGTHEMGYLLEFNDNQYWLPEFVLELVKKGKL